MPGVVRMLLDHGAVVDKRAMRAARETGDEEVILMLEEKFEESVIRDGHELKPTPFDCYFACILHIC